MHLDFYIFHMLQVQCSTATK